MRPAHADRVNLKELGVLFRMHSLDSLLALNEAHLRRVGVPPQYCEQLINAVELERRWRSQRSAPVLPSKPGSEHANGETEGNGLSERPGEAALDAVEEVGSGEKFENVEGPVVGGSGKAFHLLDLNVQLEEISAPGAFQSIDRCELFDKSEEELETTNAKNQEGVGTVACVGCIIVVVSCVIGTMVIQAASGSACTGSAC